MKKILLFIGLLGYCLSANAQSSAENQLLEKIKTANANCTSITSTFKQTRHFSFMDGDVISKGNFYYRKPDRLLLKYTEPAGGLLLINGDRFVMNMMDQSTKSSIKADPNLQSIQTLLSSCLQGEVKHIANAIVSCKETTAAYVVTATIKGGNAQGSKVNKVIVTYSKPDLTVSTIRTEEADNSYTLYELTGKKLNQPIADAVFKVPAGK